MPWFVPALIAGASALSGFLGNRAKKQTQYSDSTTTRNDLISPEYGQKEQIVKDRILNELLARSEADSDLTGYSALGLGNIAKGQSAKQRALQSFLASRGLGGSPMAAHAMAGMQGEQIGESVNFLNSLPMLQRNMRRESMGDLSQFFSSLPVAQRNTGTSTTRGTQTSNASGSPWASAASGGLDALGYLYGRGAFSKGSPAGTPSTFPTGPTNPYDYDQPDWSGGGDFKLPESGDYGYGNWAPPGSAAYQGF